MRPLSLSLLLVLATPLAAQEATGKALRAAVSGNTVQGSMADAAYAEFYAEDGTIKGDGYEGTWTIQGDAMCFDYGDEPAECWTAELSGDGVTWIKDGAVEGTGTVVPGNPEGF